MGRAGHFVQHAAGFKAFVPADFPPRDLSPLMQAGPPRSSRRGVRRGASSANPLYI
jgi:hypothetical protein